MSILDMLNEIWHKTMNIRYQRYNIVSVLNPNQGFTEFAMKTILNSREWSKRNTVRVATRTTAEVLQGNKKTYTVDLARKTCSCGHYQQNDIPCGHAYSIIIALNRAPRDYIPAVFSTTTLRNTYCHKR